MVGGGEQKAAASGVAWPESPDGKVSTTVTGKAIWAAAARAAGDPGARLAQRIEGIVDWRHKYTAPLVELARLQATSPDVCLAVCRAGLAAAAEQFGFVGADGERRRVAESARAGAAGLETATVRGRGGEAALAIPLQGRLHAGDAAAALVDGWVAYGSAERSVADAARSVASLPPDGLRAAVGGRVFALLGATSAACPAVPLLRAGATVAAVARPGAKLRALIDAAKELPGTLLVPVPAGTAADDEAAVRDHGGANVLTQLPEIVTWLSGLEPGSALTVGNYIYLDGEAHVRATMAMDAICCAVADARPGTSLAYLMSPATAHTVTTEAHAASAAAYDESGLLSKLNPFRWTSFVRNAELPVRGTGASGKETWVCVTDGLSTLQGPNYALAKTMQQWRATVARAGGAAVSANMAPPMYTDSMMHISTVRTGLCGMQGFIPLAVYEPETASAVMAMLLVRDVTDKESTANPAVPLENPCQLVCEGSFHGGSWRCAYKQDSIGAALFILGKTVYRNPPDAPPALASGHS